MGEYAELYLQRLSDLNLDPAGLGWEELALRFTEYAPGVHTAITGTARLQHLIRNVEIVNQGPLPTEVLTRIEDAWSRVGADWPSSTRRASIGQISPVAFEVQHCNPTAVDQQAALPRVHRPGSGPDEP